MPASCLPSWYKDADSICPYGTKMFLSVTLPTSPVSFWEWISIIYGYVGLVLGLYLIVGAALRRNTQRIYYGLGTLVIFLINEFMFKLSLGERRPEGACDIHCGNPSSHSAFAIGCLTIFLLDLLPSIGHTVPTKLNWVDLVFPLTNKIVSLNVFLWHWVVFTLLCTPIPLSRVILNDHTPVQCLIGSMIGFICGLLLVVGGYFVRARYGAKIRWELPNQHVQLETRAESRSAPYNNHCNNSIFSAKSEPKKTTDIYSSYNYESNTNQDAVSKASDTRRGGPPQDQILYESEEEVAVPILPQYDQYEYGDEERLDMKSAYNGDMETPGVGYDGVDIISRYTTGGFESIKPRKRSSSIASRRRTSSVNPETRSIADTNASRDSDSGVKYQRANNVERSGYDTYEASETKEEEILMAD